MKYIDKLLLAIGWYEVWHVSWIANRGEGVTYHGDGTITIKPRLTNRTYEDLRVYLSEQSNCAVEAINIIGMARIGE